MSTQPEKVNGNEDPVKQKKTRTGLIIAIVAMVVLQIVMVVICLTPAKPLDEILDYEVTVDPQSDGRLQIRYDVRWKVLNDSSEGPLEWIKIGAANPSFTVKEHSGDAMTVRSFESSYFRIDLKRRFYKNEVAEFGFTVLQERMLCTDREGYQYEFVPGWFPGTPVRHYRFAWNSGGTTYNNADSGSGGMLVWEGSMKINEYRSMKVGYGPEAFDRDAPAAEYRPFTFDSQPERRMNKFFTFAIFFGFLLLFPEIILISSLVSYRRGRGFTHVHYFTSGRGGGGGHGGGGGGSSCACACACACAGGGRAGCSQKDFYNKTTEYPHEGETDGQEDSEDRGKKD